MGTSMLHFVILWKIKLKKFGANRKNYIFAISYLWYQSIS